MAELTEVDLCSLPYFIASCEGVAHARRQDEVNWYNDLDQKVVAGTAICIPIDGMNKLAHPVCPICPGDCGSLHMAGAMQYEYTLDSASPNVPQFTKMYASINADGTLTATPTVPVNGYSIGFAVIDPDNHSTPGMAAVAGDSCVQVVKCCDHNAELFGTAAGGDKQPVDPPV